MALQKSVALNALPAVATVVQSGAGPTVRLQVHCTAYRIEISVTKCSKKDRVACNVYMICIYLLGAEAVSAAVGEAGCGL